MELVITLIVGLLAAGAGFAGGLKLKHRWGARDLASAQETGERILNEAKTKQQDFLLEAKDEALKIRVAAEAESRERRAELQRQERRLQQKEENLDQKLDHIDRRDQGLRQREQELTQRQSDVEELKRRQVVELERVANLSRDEARDIILRRVEEESREIAAKRAREIEQASKEDAEVKARKLLAMTIQRYAADQVAETTISVVPIPNDEMKGRIIGREGRNIRALEAATGVDLIIDDTPDAVSISGFDPIRREIAKVALTKLVLDGRIHPGRIEEIVAKAKQEVEQTIRQEGEQAALESGVHGLHPELVKAMGRMKFRTSYGQNQLQHSIEAAHLAAMMAAEMGADANIARRGGFLHDIGKALTHELEGPHHIMGAEYARRFGESPRVVECIQGHHDADPEFQSTEAVLVQAADAISGARPGARRENVEHYIQRLTALENVANSFEGVEKSYAIQAGREVRILVKPEEIDDAGASKLAREIVKKIEDTLQYPGQVKVTVVRETRAVEYAR